MVSIIIINYNQKDLLAQCVKSIFENIISYPFEVIVVNNSKEDDLSQIGNEFNIRIIENENNGYSQANNLGARKSNDKYLFFLNADTIIKNDFLKNSIELFKDKNIGAIGLKLLNEDRSFQLSFWKENTFFNEIQNKKDEKAFRRKNWKEIQKFKSRYENISEVDWVTGAAMLMPRNIFNEIEGFDEDYFLFYEDADICKRLKSIGYKIIYYPNSEIVHLKGENVNEQFHNQTYFYSKQSQLIYYKKHNNMINRFLLRVYLIIKFFLLSILTLKRINFRIFLLVAGFRNYR